VADHRKHATIRFYAELNDLLARRGSGPSVDYAFSGSPAVKDAIEALGVPHTEVELIVIDGRSVGFSHRLRDGDRVAVYPVFEAMDVSPLVRLRERPLREPRFVLDSHLGKLARLLRLLGFDSLYRNDFEDAEIVDVALEQRRIVLTRDRGILKQSRVTHGYCVRSSAPADQVREVVARFDLHARIAPFSRCTMCNGTIRVVREEDVADRIPTRARREHDEFRACEGCGRVYWKGSHYARLLALVERLFPGSVRGPDAAKE
jgi:uncharacterized protein with PIN domain